MYCLYLCLLMCKLSSNGGSNFSKIIFFVEKASKIKSKFNANEESRKPKKFVILLHHKMNISWKNYVLLFLHLMFIFFMKLIPLWSHLWLLTKLFAHCNFAHIIMFVCILCVQLAYLTVFSLVTELSNHHNS